MCAEEISVVELPDARTIGQLTNPVFDSKSFLKSVFHL